MWMMLTIGVAALGGLAFKQMKIPAGMLVGAILAVSALNLTTQQAFMYPQARVLAQTLTGAYIGCLVTREDIRALPKLIRPYLTVMALLLVLNLGMGVLMYSITDFDLLTCLFCASPGGISDMPLVAMDMGANGSIVAVMQFVRLVFGLSCLPTVVLMADRMIEPEAAQAMEDRAVELNQGRTVQRRADLKAFLPTFGVALGAGVLGKLSGLPAGTLSAAMIAAIAMKLSGKYAGMPQWLRRVAQVISGCCIGAAVTRAQVAQLGQLIFPAILLCLGYITCCVAGGMLISKMFHMNLREAMLSFSPAGATEMALIAADLGVESTNLVVIQIGRLVGAMLVFPQIFQLIIWLIN